MKISNRLLDKVVREVLSQLSKHRWDKNMLLSTDIKLRKSLPFWGLKYVQILSFFPHAGEREKLFEVGIGYDFLAAMRPRLFPRYDIFGLGHRSKRYLSSREYGQFLKERRINLI